MGEQYSRHFSVGKGQSHTTQQSTSTPPQDDALYVHGQLTTWYSKFDSREINGSTS